MHTLGVVMDPIGSIKIQKDSTFAMLLSAQARGWPLFYMELADLSLRDGRAWGRMRALTVSDDPAGWFRFGDEQYGPLDQLDALLMRKDPPFDTEYVYSTYLLERAMNAGTLVVNDPRSIRNANEKLFVAWFSEWAPPTLVSRRAQEIRGFLNEQRDIILKPLGGMGGASVFRLRHGDPNTSVIIETLTDDGNRYAMAQRFLPEIREGDKRILLVDGVPVPYALARIPAQGETRGNLAAGGRGEGVPLSHRDQALCAAVGPVLRDLGLMFVGLDVIGDRLTEINVTSPTCIRELDAIYGLDISGQLMDAIARKLA